MHNLAGNAMGVEVRSQIKKSENLSGCQDVESNEASKFSARQIEIGKKLDKFLRDNSAIFNRRNRFPNTEKIDEIVERSLLEQGRKELMLLYDVNQFAEDVAATSGPALDHGDGDEAAVTAALEHGESGDQSELAKETTEKDKSKDRNGLFNRDRAP